MNDNEFIEDSSYQDNEKQINYNKFNINICIRVKPDPNQDESDNQYNIYIDERTNQCKIQQEGYQINSKFDKAFEKNAEQIRIFEYFSKFLNQTFNGYNFTLFAYGQTGSGKTYTMFGNDWENLIFDIKNKFNKKQKSFFQQIGQDTNYAGIIPRTIYYLFQKSNQYNHKFNIKIECSFLQIYNEKIYDLISDNQTQQITIHESVTNGVFLEGLIQTQVNSYQQALDLMQKGEQNRKIRQTQMNGKSSRSHSIFQLVLHIKDKYNQDSLTKVSKINLCDLAGSEKIDKTKIMDENHFNELKHINLSLTTLGQVIRNLSLNKRLRAPFRQSKLTRVLQDSLVGNTITSIIFNLCALKQNIRETVRSLKFAEMAKNVFLSIKTNEIQTKDSEIVKKLQTEIQYLKQLLYEKKDKVKTFSQPDLSEALKKSNFSQEEVLNLIEENRKMKIQIQKSSIKRDIKSLNRNYFQMEKKNKENVTNFTQLPYIDSSKSLNTVALNVHSSNQLSKRSVINSEVVNQKPKLRKPSKMQISIQHGDIQKNQKDKLQEKIKILERIGNLTKLQDNNQNNLLKELNIIQSNTVFKNQKCFLQNNSASHQKKDLIQLKTSSKPIKNEKMDNFFTYI